MKKYRSDKQLIDLAQDGDRKARNDLVKKHRGFVYRVAQTLSHGMGVYTEDYYQCGLIGLNRSIDKYDESKGVKFLSFAVWYIRQEIFTNIGLITRPVSIPPNLNVRMNQAKKEYESLFTEKKGDVRIEDVEDQKGLKNYLRLSKFARLSIPISEGGYVIGTCDNDNLEREDYRKIINNLFQYCTTREVDIMLSYYGVKTGEPMPQEVLSERYGITRAGIGEVVKAVKRKMKKGKMLVIKEALEN